MIKIQLIPNKSIKEPYFCGGTKDRQGILNKLNANLKYFSGDIVKPFSKEMTDIYGDEIIVCKIVTLYSQIKNEAWPKNNNPKIIHAYSRKNKINFMCTANFLIPNGNKCH